MNMARAMKCTSIGIRAILALFFMIMLFLPFFYFYHQFQQDYPLMLQVQLDTAKREESRMNIPAELLQVDSLSRQLGQQIILAKSYVIIAKDNSNFRFARELSSQIRAAQILLSKAAARGKSVSKEEAEPIITGLSLLIHQAKGLHYDSAVTIMKLKLKIVALEQKNSDINAQSITFGQQAAEAIPKELYCLGIKLIMEFSTNNRIKKYLEDTKYFPNFTNNSLYHICIFSDNILATSVVVNSTVSNTNEPKQFVFHIVTGSFYYRAMQAWFSITEYREATIEVKSVEEFSWLNASYVPVLKQLQDTETRGYYFKSSSVDAKTLKTAIKFRNPKYLSILNHLRFYIPEIYPKLNKVVFLDDDVVVQKDLKPLFSIDLHGNVNGAVETCLETFHRLYKYVNFSQPAIQAHFDPESCSWAFGMNVFDLKAWREANLTSKYHHWQELNENRTFWKLGTLPAGLLTFYGVTEALDPKWHVLGLGYDPNVDEKVIENAAVVHYNGNMKPWSKLGMQKYKAIWENYVDYSHPFLQQCLMH